MNRLTPDQILTAIQSSLSNWVEELEAVEKCCPQKVGHLLASMKQAQDSLKHLTNAIKD